MNESERNEEYEHKLTEEERHFRSGGLRRFSGKNASDIKMIKMLHSGYVAQCHMIGSFDEYMQTRSEDARDDCVASAYELESLQDEVENLKNDLYRDRNYKKYAESEKQIERWMSEETDQYQMLEAE